MVPLTVILGSPACWVLPHSGFSRWTFPGTSPETLTIALRPMKLILALAAAGGAVGLVSTGVVPCPCECVGAHVRAALEGGPGEAANSSVPEGLYLEVRNATVWGGACHIGSEAVSQGTHAVMGWAFEAGSHGGVNLEGTRVIAAIQGQRNLQGDDVFGLDAAENPVRATLWVDAPNAPARAAALGYIRSTAGLVDGAEARDAVLEVARTGDRFQLGVPGVLEVRGDAMADRSCCTMPESVWYSPLAGTAVDAIVGNPDVCRFSGIKGELEPWAFEGENSAFLARISGGIHPI